MACYFITINYGEKSTQKYFFSLANELASRGHQVIIIVAGQRHEVEDKNGNPVILTWPSKRPTGWRDWIFFRALVKQYKPDCIIANFAAVNISTLVGWVSQVPVRIAWYHTMSKAIDTDSKMPRWKSFVQRQRKRFIYSFATHLVAVSRAAAEDAAQIYQIALNKRFVLPVLIADPRTYCIQSETERIVCVGRLHQCKGQETLIRAVPHLKKLFPSIIVEFIGEGPERQNYEHLVQTLKVADNCYFIGNQPSQKVFERMALATVCVTPSTNDAFPLVTVEAQSVGAPVVASKIDGIKEVVLDGETGFLVDSGDAEAFANKISLLLGDKELRAEFSKQARIRFENNFSIKNISRHVDFFEQLVTA